MNHILQILQVVLVVSLVIGAVWAFGGLLGKKAGYGWRKLLWLVSAVCLLAAIPLSHTSITGVWRGIEIAVKVPEEIVVPEGAFWQENTVVTEGDVLPEGDVATNMPEASGQDGANVGNTPLLQESGYVSVPKGSTDAEDGIVENASRGNHFSVANCIVFVWCVGAVLLTALHIRQYVCLRKTYLAGTVVCEDSDILECRDRICEELGIGRSIPVRVGKNDLNTGKPLMNSPMLFGYGKSVLFLPDANYQSGELEAVLRHELTHYRLGDLWYKLLMVAVCDIYWFDPILRLMKKMAFHDVEFVCDEKATASFDLGEKKAYSSIILKTMSGVRGGDSLFATGFGGNKKSAKERFENIFASHNRKMGIVILGALVIVIAVGVIGVSVSVSDDGEQVSASVEEEQAGASAENEQASTSVEEEQAVETEKHAVTVELAILPENGEAILASVQQKYPEYSLSSVDMTTQYFYDEFFEQEPTLFQISSLDVPGLSQEGKIADITEVLEQRGWLAQMDDAARVTVSDAEGKVYGIPMPNAYTYGIVVNVKMFEEAGLVDDAGVPVFPTTWEELAQTAVAIKDATGQPGLCLIANENDYTGCLHYINLAWNFGATDLITLEADGSYKTHLDSEGAVAAMEFVKALKWEYDILTEDPTQEGYLTGYEHLAAGTAAMYMGSNDALSLATGYGMDVTELAMCAMPAGPDGEQYSCYGNSVYAFSADATAEEIDVALSVLEAMGFGPSADEAAKDRIRTKVQRAVEAGGPAIREISVWKNAELLEYEQSVLEELGNTNQAYYADYFHRVLTPGNLKGSDTIANSELFMLLASVLDEVVTNPDADVAQLMQAANENWQKVVTVYMAESSEERGIAY